MALKALWRRMTVLDRCILALMLMLCAYLLRQTTLAPKGRTLVVERQGRVILTAPLDEPRTLALQGPLGETLLEIRDGQACVKSSPCPNQVCLGMGKVGRGGQILACVPNQILVRIEGASEEKAEYDLLSR